ncbi:MAG: CYTH domain-containing protein [Candidatus Devosia phytovorans]|uniref:CYTH domain-containing protein n=1 Tax=Candidatus Devosia phytovorans TaxID=3121372 RepID=A0AAJ5VVG0_9HYPH|nr:CYTH domain-containing protein [Devosia sp.]WEK05638.1 MAG: CYTH domain-containing protein [Devosia sp.]
MAQEIERKFLVSSDGWKRGVASSELLRQGYLSSNAKATVRVRTKDDAEAYVTIKGATSGMSRAEYEYAVPVDDAREMLVMAAPHVVEKRRHIVPFGGLTWEVDVFEGRHAGLVMAEVELEAEDQAVELPEWIGREVTEDDRYFNASLSRADGPPD